MQRPRRTPRHDSPLHSRWMSKRLRGCLTSLQSSPGQSCLHLNHRKGQRGSLVKFTSCLGLSSMTDGGRADVWIKGSHLVVLSQVQVPQEPSRCLGMPSDPRALQGSRRCMPSTWGTMAVSSPKRRLKSQAACCVDLRKERWPPLPSPILVAACHGP